MLHLIPPYRINGSARCHVINDMAVRAGNNGSVIGTLGPALDLQTAEARVHQLFHMVDHAHIPGVQDIGALLVLKHWEVFARPLLLHQVILIAAGLGAGAPVAVPSGHVVGKQASPGVAYAHGAMDECLQFQILRNFFTDLPNLTKTQLPSQNHPLGSQVVPGVGTDVVGHTGLCAYMALTAGGVLSRKGKGSHVCHNQGVHPGLLELLQVGWKVDDLVIPGHGVHGDVDPDTVVMGPGHCLRQLFRGKIPGKGAHTEGGTRQIHGVSPVEHCHTQPLHIPRWGQQLRLLSLYHAHIPSQLVVPAAAAAALAFSCSLSVLLNTCVPSAPST